MRVAVLGTGIMGAGMARSLLRDGHTVRVWNRSPHKAKALGDDGAMVASSALEAATGADAVLTMLYDTDAVMSVIKDAADGFGAGTVWLQSSTIGLAGAAAVADFAHKASLNVLDAPVLGTKQPAETGNLVVLVSGDQALLKRVDPVLQAIGSRSVWVGGGIGRASALKLACNAWVASINAAVGQSVALAQSLGLDGDLFLDAIRGGAVDTPYAHPKAAAMMAEDYTTSFAVDGVLKDLRLISEAASRSGVDDALLSALTRVYQRASDDGHGDDDMAAVYTAFRRPRTA
jgi:3-hydroxyisobutyrate dehydrogenase